MTRPVAVHVVIPAHDEADLIDACLRSVRIAVDRLRASTGIDATITVVADSCTDATVEIAQRRSAEVVSIDDRAVGMAREAGVRHVLGRWGAAEPSRVWIATTDADSTVEPHWLEDQVRIAATGTMLWIGAVRPDPSSLTTSAMEAWSARHLDPAELHVHGANLGFTVDAYLRVGGFAPMQEHEDVAFVHAALADGCSWTAGTSTVHTSSRTQGRTPGGFAGYLTLLVAELEEA